MKGAHEGSHKDEKSLTRARITWSAGTNGERWDARLPNDAQFCGKIRERLHNVSGVCYGYIDLFTACVNVDTDPYGSRHTRGDVDSYNAREGRFFDE